MLAMSEVALTSMQDRQDELLVVLKHCSSRISAIQADVAELKSEARQRCAEGAVGSRAGGAEAVGGAGKTEATDRLSGAGGAGDVENAEATERSAGAAGPSDTRDQEPASDLSGGDLDGAGGRPAARIDLGRVDAIIRDLRAIKWEVVQNICVAGTLRERISRFASQTRPRVGLTAQRLAGLQADSAVLNEGLLAVKQIANSVIVDLKLLCGETDPDLADAVGGLQIDEKTIRRARRAQSATPADTYGKKGTFRLADHSAVSRELVLALPYDPADVDHRLATREYRGMTKERAGIQRMCRYDLFDSEAAEKEERVSAGALEADEDALYRALSEAGRSGIEGGAGVEAGIGATIGSAAGAESNPGAGPSSEVVASLSPGALAEPSNALAAVSAASSVLEYSLPSPPPAAGARPQTIRALAQSLGRVQKDLKDTRERLYRSQNESLVMQEVFHEAAGRLKRENTMLKKKISRLSSRGAEAEAGAAASQRPRQSKDGALGVQDTLEAHRSGKSPKSQRGARSAKRTNTAKASRTANGASGVNGSRRPTGASRSRTKSGSRRLGASETSAASLTSGALAQSSRLPNSTLIASSRFSQEDRGRILRAGDPPVDRRAAAQASANLTRLARSMGRTRSERESLLLPDDAIWTGMDSVSYMSRAPRRFEGLPGSPAALEPLPPLSRRAVSASVLRASQAIRQSQAITRRLEDEAQARLRGIEDQIEELDDSYRELMERRRALGEGFTNGGLRNDVIRSTTRQLVTRGRSAGRAHHPKDFELLGVDRAEPFV